MLKQYLKKILILILTTFITNNCLSFNYVFAEEETEITYPFEVYDISEQGEYTLMASFEDFDNAYEKMHEYPNGVVINKEISKSPSGIIAMSGGIIMSYTYRKGTNNNKNDSLAYIYQVPYSQRSGYTKNTYVASYNEAEYLGTIIDEGEYLAEVNCNGFMGHMFLYQVDLIPYVILENNLEITLGGNEYQGTNNTFVSKPKRCHYEISNDDLIFVSYSFFDSSTKNVSCKVGHKADWMENDKIYYSNDDIHYYNDIRLTDLAGVYYNYYQFLPLRSKTSVTAEEMNNYLHSLSSRQNSIYMDKAQLFIDVQEKYGINALLLYALAALESGWGTSNYAINRYNLFGWNANDNSPDDATRFNSLEHSLSEMTGINLRKYLDTRSPLFFGSHFGNKSSGFNVKYCSGQSWGKKIASIAYSINKTANNRDYLSYKLGVVKYYKCNVYSQADLNSEVIYTTEYGSSYQKDFVMIINREVGDFYEVQSTQPLINHTNDPDSADFTKLVEYNYLESVGYILKTDLEVISESKYEYPEVSNEVASDLINEGNLFNLESFVFTDNGLNISGYSFNKGIGCLNDSDITHQLVIQNVETKTEKTYDLINTSINPEIVSERGLSFANGGFKADNLMVYGLDNGEYDFYIRTSYNRYDYSFDSKIVLSEVPDISKYKTGFTFEKLDGLRVLVESYVEKEALIYVSKLDWQEDKLNIKALIALKETNHDESDKISKQLIITNIETNQKYYFDLANKTSKEITDGFDFIYDIDHNYEYVWFDELIDLKDLPEGDYLFYISCEIQNGYQKLYGHTYLANTLVGNNPNNKVIDNKTYQIQKNGAYRSRYQLTITNGLNDELMKINKPTNRLTNFYLNKFDISDGKVSLDGFMYMYNINHVENVQYSLLLVNEGQVKYSFDLDSYKGLYDVTDLIGGDKNYLNCWFKGDNLDLSNVEKGEYVLYIVEKNGDYFDIINLVDNYQSFIKSSTLNNIKYSTLINTKRYNMMLFKMEEIA